MLRENRVIATITLFTNIVTMATLHNGNLVYNGNSGLVKYQVLIIKGELSNASLIISHERIYLT